MEYRVTYNTRMLNVTIHYYIPHGLSKTKLIFSVMVHSFLPTLLYIFFTKIVFQTIVLMYIVLANHDAILSMQTYILWNIFTIAKKRAVDYIKHTLYVKSLVYMRYCCSTPSEQFVSYKVAIRSK